MKKIIIIAFAVITTGLASSCSKDNTVKPAAAKHITTGDNGDLSLGE